MKITKRISTPMLRKCPGAKCSANLTKVIFGWKLHLLSLVFFKLILSSFSLSFSRSLSFRESVLPWCKVLLKRGKNKSEKLRMNLSGS